MSSIFEKTVCLAVTFHRPYALRKASMDGIETDGDKNELRMSKRIFSSPSYRACEMLAAKTRKWLEGRSVPSPLRDGTYLIPEALLTDVNEKLNEVSDQYNAYADQFSEEYPDLIEQWKEKLGSHFRAADYVTSRQIRRRFSVQRLLINFSPARPDEIDQRAEIESAICEIKASLRADLLMLVEKMVAMLGERRDGKKRGFQDRALESFTEWIDLLPARLVVDDDELKKVAERARKIMSGKSADDLRDIDSVRSKVREGLSKVETKLRGMVRELPSRAFGFDDE